MQSPTSPMYSTGHDAGFAFPSSPRHNNKQQHSASNKIDYSKFKTKLCRNFSLGLPCPFGDSCAFSHGARDLEPVAQPHGITFLSSARDMDVEDTSSSTGSLGSPKNLPTIGFGTHTVVGADDVKPGVSGYFSSNSSERNSYSSLNNTVAGQNANATEFLPPPPPSYDAAVSVMGYGRSTSGPYSSGTKAAAGVPPSYPTRYRHDPYSFACIRYD